MSKILAIVEHRDGAIRPASLNALTLARQAAEGGGGEVVLLVMGAGVAGVAEAAAAYGPVVVADQPELEHYTAEAHGKVVAEAIAKLGVRLVVAPASTMGKDLLPRVSGLTEAGLASDVSTFETLTVDAVRFKREMWAGNVLGTVEIAGPLALVSVRATEFAAAAPLEAAGAVTPLDAVGLGQLGARFVDFEPAISDRPDLAEARVIVSVGRGTKGPEGIAVCEKLADFFGAAIGATRTVVDAGWLPNDLQVGQTGKVVAPELYFAIGISGAIQHWAGMKGSKVIVAINKDEEAPIMSVASYALVADLFKAVPELVEKLNG